jgi:hypothetical protein
LHRKAIKEKTFLEVIKQHSNSTEQENEDFLAQIIVFEMYILCFMLKFSEKVYQLIINEEHAVQHFKSDIS